MTDKHSMNPFAVAAWTTGAVGAAVYIGASVGAANAVSGVEDFAPWIGLGSWAAGISIPAALVLSGARWLIRWNDARQTTGA
ncbi:hypothetical protein [Microbacterium resistens]